MKLVNILNNRDNNFTLLRLAAATFVLVHHMYVFVGENGRLHWTIGETLGSAIQIFIIISGFLVTKSWMSDPRPLVFVKKRVLRVFPALICSILLAVLVIGPLVTRAHLQQYFSHPLTWAYLKNVFLFPLYYNLPGVFMGNPVPYAVNGSLWSLPIEVFLYGVLITLGLTRVVRSRAMVAVLAVTLIAGEQYFKPVLSTSRIFFLTMPLSNLLSLGIFFFIGALYYLYSEKIVLNKWVALIFIPLFLSLNKLQLPMSEIIRYAILPYIILYIAYADIPFSSLLQKTDVSYGVYVYAFPIQQTMVNYFYGELDTYLILLLSLAIVLAVSYASWRFVEKPSLALAHKRALGAPDGAPERHDGTAPEKISLKSRKKRSKRTAMAS